MNFKVLPLRGLKSVSALNAYQTLLFGLATEAILAGACVAKTEDKNAKENDQYDDILAAFEALTLEDKAIKLRHAIKAVNLQEEDMLNLCAFAEDANGIPFGKVNMANLEPQDIIEIMLAVCLELSKIKPRMLAEDVKKNSPNLA